MNLITVSSRWFTLTLHFWQKLTLADIFLAEAHASLQQKWAELTRCNDLNPDRLGNYVQQTINSYNTQLPYGLLRS